MFWLGEYAVLDGAPAVVAAVDRYAVTLRRDADTAVYFCHDEGAFPLWSASGELLPDGVWDGADLVAAVAAEVHARFGAPAACRLHTDSTALSSDTKLGLGSSGAVAAGLAAALMPDLDADAALELALAAHWRFQDGRGSGADVVASCFGGLSVMQRGMDPTPVEAPSDLQFMALYTGVAANTRTLVDAFRAWQSSDPSSANVVNALTATATAGVDALRGGDVSGWLAAVGAYVELERALTNAGVGIANEPVERALRAAEEAGWVAKPSGAGGGDVVVCFGAATADPERLIHAARDAAVEPVPLALAPSGVLSQRRENS